MQPLPDVPEERKAKAKIVVQGNKTFNRVLPKVLENFETNMAIQ